MGLAKNKKATENWIPDTMPFFILFIIVVGFGVAILLIMMNYFAAKQVQIPKGVEESILIERFYNSPDCFAYKDEEIGITYQKIIDLDKFRNQDAINKCISHNNLKFAFKLELEDTESKEKTITATPNWIDNSKYSLIQKSVFIYHNDNVKNGKLSIFVQNVQA